MCKVCPGMYQGCEGEGRYQTRCAVDLLLFSSPTTVCINLPSCTPHRCVQGLPLHAIGLPALLADAGARSAEEALVHAVTEARRAAPAVLFLPHLEVRLPACACASHNTASQHRLTTPLVNTAPQLWWSTAPLSLQSTLWTLLEDLPSDLPLLLLATADCLVHELAEDCPEALQLFASYGSGVYALGSPGAEARSAFFKPLCEALAAPPAPPTTAAEAVPEACWFALAGIFLAGLSFFRVCYCCVGLCGIAFDFGQTSTRMLTVLLHRLSCLCTFTHTLHSSPWPLRKLPVKRQQLPRQLPVPRAPPMSATRACCARCVRH